LEIGIYRARLAALDRRCNDMIADWVRRYPGRFVGTFTMPLKDPYLALQEMERAR